MARTLIIKDANFSANKIETVSFDENVPCTGITLSDSTKTLTTIGATYNLVATPAPANTSDAVTWASSNSTVVSVENGLITALAIGSATITVTCGNYSATCVVTVAVAYAPNWRIGKQAIKYTQTATGLIFLGQDTLTQGAYGCLLTGTYKIRSTTPDQFPYPIPNGATKISISAEGCRIGMWFSDTTTPVEGTSYAGIVGDGNNAGASAAPEDSAVYTIPEGANAFALTVKLVSGETFTEDDLEGITVTFLAE